MDMKCMSHSTTNRTKPNTEKPCRATSRGAMLLRGDAGLDRPPRVGQGPADRPHSGNNSNKRRGGQAGDKASFPKQEPVRGSELHQLRLVVWVPEVRRPTDDQLTGWERGKRRRKLPKGQACHSESLSKTFNP
ncbi:hypothetical protein CRENBAI_009713 [Crenichthys baileyi]|uniref:Uncharacterized protein n=1 Tax=Crenichthys baileyi TaxID=28760 RepID=A0AAV9QVV9_9TELE